jgi:hypothetical protein
MKLPMTHAQALQKARQLLGPTAKVIRDSERSSNKIRREASIERAKLRQALKRFDLSPARRAELQAFHNTEGSRSTSALRWAPSQRNSGHPIFLCWWHTPTAGDNALQRLPTTRPA